MKNKLLTILLITILAVTVLFAFTSCEDSAKTIYVCASELPHADILQNCVAPLLKEQGYTLKVKILDWTLQNDAVANGDYDANYFQHVPYLSLYNGATQLVATCKVHYEPLGIYRGKATGELADGKTFAICKDESNAIRALNLLLDKGVITQLPVTDGKLDFSNSWTDNGITVTLIDEALLVASMPDYDFVCLPCNTALTGNVEQSKRVAYEDGEEFVSQNANVLAVRANDYANDSQYKTKIDALTDALLSQEVSNYVMEKWNGAIPCDQSCQIDLR